MRRESILASVIALGLMSSLPMPVLSEDVDQVAQTEKPKVEKKKPEKDTKPEKAEQPSKETHEGQPVSFWMQKKLDFSKNILEGISAADFDKVSQNAKTLRSLNRIESFIRGRTPGYRTQLQLFEESLGEIIRQSDKENVEGVTLGFHQLTVSCVNCHKQLREAK